MKSVETLTQGGARGDSGPELLPLVGPGLVSFARALRGTGGILPPDFSKNVQSPAHRFAVGRSFFRSGQSPRLRRDGRRGTSCADSHEADILAPGIWVF